MAWRGFNNNKDIPASNESINIQPNVNIDGQNYSEVKSNKIQSRDSGEVIKNQESVGNLPYDGNVYNKVNAVRRDTDNQKDFSVSIEDVDKTIINYMTNHLDLSIMDNGFLTKTPVMYATPERWYSVQKDGYLRDNQGKILLPLIMIRREDITNDKSLMTLNRYLTYPVYIKYDEKNKYDRFDLLTNGKYTTKRPKQVYNVKLPDHVVISYEGIIWTDYIDQNNKLLETINYATHDYWGIDRFRFRTRIDSYTTAVEMDNGTDRNVRSTFKLNVNAYLLPKTIDAVKSTTTKEITPRTLEIETGNIKKEDKIDFPFSKYKKYTINGD